LKLTRLAVGAAALAVFCASASADLGVGMKAPKLEVAKWFKGKPVQVGDGKMLSVIEFWATW
jgi:hypothetical protein